jgi:site-specific DNA recombinase
MNPIQAALYARVSSAHQAEAHTVASQVVALRERIAADGLAVPEALQLIDEGYSGATLVRPALERLRDLAAAGAVDRLYVHSPTSWPANTPIKCCWWMSSSVLGWK